MWLYAPVMQPGNTPSIRVWDVTTQRLDEVCKRRGGIPRKSIIGAAIQVWLELNREDREHVTRLADGSGGSGCCVILNPSDHEKLVQIKGHTKTSTTQLVEILLTAFLVADTARQTEAIARAAEAERADDAVGAGDAVGGVAA